MKIRINERINIDAEELTEDFVRSSGPGGQNVNKVSTAVRLRFDARNSPSLSDSVRERLAGLAGKRLSKEGVVTINARRFRTQERNRADAISRLVELVRLAAEEPASRTGTKPTKGSISRRLESKARHARTKRERSEARVPFE